MLNTGQISANYENCLAEWLGYDSKRCVAPHGLKCHHVFCKALHCTASPGSAKSSSMNWSACIFSPWQLEQRQIILPLAVVTLKKTKHNKNKKKNHIKSPNPNQTQKPHCAELDQERHLQTACEGQAGNESVEQRCAAGNIDCAARAIQLLLSGKTFIWKEAHLPITLCCSPACLKQEVGC